MTVPSDEHASELMAEGAQRLVAGVAELGAAWVVAAVRRILDAWGRLDDEHRARALAAATTAGDAAAARVSSELRALFAQDPADQRATPLEILRSLRMEATAVLADAGVPPVERDQYETRAFPDDAYGVVLTSPNDLGDDDLGGALLAWGLGKAAVLRARAGPSRPE